MILRCFVEYAHLIEWYALLSLLRQRHLVRDLPAGALATAPAFCCSLPVLALESFVCTVSAGVSTAPRSFQPTHCRLCGPSRTQSCLKFAIMPKIQISSRNLGPVSVCIFGRRQLVKSAEVRIRHRKDDEKEERWDSLGK